MLVLKLLSDASCSLAVLHAMYQDESSFRSSLQIFSVTARSLGRMNRHYGPETAAVRTAQVLG
jgi:hypothetical protein